MDYNRELPENDGDFPDSGSGNVRDMEMPEVKYSGNLE